MQIAAIEPVTAPREASPTGREPASASAFEELLQAARAAGDVGVPRYKGTNVALDETAPPDSADARAGRLSSMKADDRASRSPTGSRIAGSEVPADATESNAENRRAAGDNRSTPGDQTTQSVGRTQDGGDADKSWQTASPRQSINDNPPSAQPASTDQRVPDEGESPRKADGYPSDRVAETQNNAASSVSAQDPVATASLAQVQVTKPPASTSSAEKIVGTRSAAQLRDATPSRVRARPAIRQAREAVAKRPEQRAAIDRIVKTIQAGTRGKETVARIELAPPALGHLRVRMHLKDDVLQVRVVAETDDAKRVLTSQVDELRTALEQQGVKVQRLAFHGPGDGDSPAGNRHDFGNPNSGAFNGDARQAFTPPSNGGQRGRERKDMAQQEPSEPRTTVRAVSESATGVTDHAGELRVDIRI